MVEYKVIESISWEDFHKYVRNHIDAGWQPFGGVSAPRGENERVIGYAQAMVKYQKEKNT